MVLHLVFQEFQRKGIVSRIRYEPVGTQAGDGEAGVFACAGQDLGNPWSFIGLRFAVKEEADFFALFLHAEKKGVMFDKNQILVTVGHLITEAFEKGLEDTKGPDGDGG